MSKKMSKKDFEIYALKHELKKAEAKLKRRGN